MAYRPDRRVREQYDDSYSNTGGREVRIKTERRAVGFWPEPEYNRGYDEDQRFGGPHGQLDGRGYRGEGGYPFTNREYSDENANPGHFHRNSSPQRRDDSYPFYREEGQGRRQVDIRGSGRAGPYHWTRGLGSGPHMRSMPATSDRGDKIAPGYAGRREDHDDYRRRELYGTVRDRSPIRREVQPSMPSRSGSNSSSRSYSPEQDRGYSYQQMQQRHDPRPLPRHIPGEFVEESQGSPRSPGAQKEEPAALATEPEEVPEANKELTAAPEEDVKARRSQAIASKAKEIERLYRQDCETFGAVVKMLVAKEPSLEQLLQAPLNENLEEIKQRCLDDLKHFIKDLDEVLQPVESST